MTLFLLLFAGPFHLWPTDPAAFASFAAHWREPLVRLFFFVLIGGSLFHGTHRLKYMLVDAGLRGRATEAFLDIVLNALAIFGSLGALYYAVHGWLF
ncbi:MAG: hypothetical protein L3J78_03895 [Thermoplasmata archaeon]|nr:hypothetical protein [Thermoplasmata archaeon]